MCVPELASVAVKAGGDAKANRHFEVAAAAQELRRLAGEDGALHAVAVRLFPAEPPPRPLLALRHPQPRQAGEPLKPRGLAVPDRPQTRCRVDAGSTPRSAPDRPLIDTMSPDRPQTETTPDRPLPHFAPASTSSRLQSCSPDRPQISTPDVTRIDIGSKQHRHRIGPRSPPQISRRERFQIDPHRLRIDRRSSPKRPHADVGSTSAAPPGLCDAGCPGEADFDRDRLELPEGRRKVASLHAL